MLFLKFLLCLFVEGERLQHVTLEHPGSPEVARSRQEGLSSDQAVLQTPIWLDFSSLISLA